MKNYSKGLKGVFAKHTLKQKKTNKKKKKPNIPLIPGQLDKVDSTEITQPIDLNS